MVDQAQAIEHYGCSCGFTTPHLAEFRKHILFESKKEGKGTHTSIGRVNPETGEVVLPRWEDRTKEEKESSTQGRYKKGSKNGDQVKQTEHLGEATHIKVVPRVFTIDYSPVMRAAQEAAIRYFGWRQDMPLGNFLDTVLYLYFLEHGIYLTGYVVTDELVEQLQDREEVKVHGG